MKGMIAKPQVRSSSGATTCSLMSGYQITETSGTATAVVKIRDHNASGTICAWINLQANQSVGEQFGDNPVQAPTDIYYLELVSGAANMVVYGSGN